MKKIITFVFALMIMGGCAMAQETIQLPQPDMQLLKMSTGEAMQLRRSGRSYQNQAITDQQLSTILWASVGINDPKGGRLVTPTAVNMQDIKVYVCNEKGVWLYNAKANNLTQVSSEDLRPSLCARQMFVMDAPVTLLLVSEQSGRQRASERYGAMDAGYLSHAEPPHRIWEVV